MIDDVEELNINNELEPQNVERPLPQRLGNIHSSTAYIITTFNMYQTTKEVSAKSKQKSKTTGSIQTCSRQERMCLLMAKPIKQNKNTLQPIASSVKFLSDCTVVKLSKPIQHPLLPFCLVACSLILEQLSSIRRGEDVISGQDCLPSVTFGVVNTSDIRQWGIRKRRRRKPLS